MNSFSFRININKLLVYHCVDELEQIKALCDVIAMLWYIPNRNCNRLLTSIMAMQMIKSLKYSFYTRIFIVSCYEIYQKRYV